MNSSAGFLSPVEAARRLGVSPKALRLYEQRGLLEPTRSAAGWRAYGPDAMLRAAEIVALRGLGLSLAQVSRVLGGEAEDLRVALGTHQEKLEAEVRQVGDRLVRVRSLRSDLDAGRLPAAGAVADLRAAAPALGIELPWPWGGEWFELATIPPLGFITGPLGSGKTRLAMRLAEAMPGGRFLGLGRSDDQLAAEKMSTDAGLRRRIELVQAQLVETGGTASQALVALLCATEAQGPSVLVIDMVEQGLDQATQVALIAYLRRSRREGGSLMLMTRSSAILDLDAVGADEAIILCPANHSTPMLVAPRPGSPGYEAVTQCLATPEVRARTEGVIAMRPAG